MMPTERSDSREADVVARPPGPTSIVGPCAIAFLASASVMIVELLAFRFVSRYLGNSIYTVTAIIGVVLGGLAIGNYVGGFLADRFRLGRTLSLFFVLSSAGCFAVPVINRLVGEWSALAALNWPQHIAVHVILTFSLPSLLLGTIGPIVAKMALERTVHVGRTVGSVYACGALGSIVGTFACGFFLIPNFGNHAVIQCVGGMLALLALICGARDWLPRGWAGASIFLLALGLAPWPWARTFGADWGLRENITPHVLFDADSEYGHVRIEESSETPGLRTMILDKLEHSYLDVNRPDDFHYEYEQVFSSITNLVAGQRDAIRALALGGGGYTFPRHILRHWPRSDVDVAEIDPVVTQAAMAAFELTPDPRIKIVHLDARQHLVDLLRRKNAGEPIAPFDIAFLDSFNDFNVPFHLTTKECDEMVYSLLSDDGVYLTVLIDVLEVGDFLGSMLKTLGQTFAHCECIYAGEKDEPFNASARNTFVVVASKKDLRLERLVPARVAAHRLTRRQLDDLIHRPNALVLTDDYAPVESLLLNVVKRMSKDRPWKADALKFYNLGNSESAQGHYADAIVAYRRALELEPAFHLAYINLSLAQIELKQYQAAITSLQKAAEVRPDLPNPLIDLGGVYMLLHDYEKAVEIYERAIRINPDYANSYNALGMALGNLGRLEEARSAFRRALDLHPDFAEARENLNRVDGALRPSPSTRPSSN